MGKKGRKIRKSPKSNDEGSTGRSHRDELESAIDTVAHIMRVSDEQELPIETFFLRHRHSLSSCDGDGAYNIISLFTLNPTILPPGIPEHSIVTTVCIRCHDNIRVTLFLTTAFLAQMENCPDKSSEDCYRDFVEQQQNTTGCGFRPAPYRQCSKLIADCLLRMKCSNKVLSGKEERTVVRLFGLPSTDPFHQSETILPVPGPAPDVTTLWITLNRPDYYFFHVSEDLDHLYGETSSRGPKRDSITREDLEKSLHFIVQDEYRRKRLLAMLGHMAMWHMLGNEQDVASWLLWEQKSMMEHAVEHLATFESMKNNIILQLMVNKFFRCGCGDQSIPQPIPQFPHLDLYGEGISNFFYYTQHMARSGKLPEAFIVTASVARDVGSIGSETNADVEEVNTNGICRTLKSLKIKRSSCAVCGATRSTSGDHLSRCAKCESVAYCCQEHQAFHWKKGGHKQQCSK
jgi:hypothetical protein